LPREIIESHLPAASALTIEHSICTIFINFTFRRYHHAKYSFHGGGEKKLAENLPEPATTKMKGNNSFHRIRVGDYRIVYIIDEDRLVILVVKGLGKKELSHLACL